MQVTLELPTAGSIELWKLRLVPHLWWRPSLRHSIDCRPQDCLPLFLDSMFQLDGLMLVLSVFLFHIQSRSFHSLRWKPYFKLLAQVTTILHLEGPRQHTCFVSAHSGCPWLLPLIQPPNVPSRLCASGCGKCSSHPPWSLSPMSYGGRPSSHALLDDLVVFWI